MSYVSFIFLSEDWFHISVHPKELALFLPRTALRRALGFWMRTTVNSSRVESKYWPCFWGITVQQSIISGGYKVTRRLSQALILTLYSATQIFISNVFWPVLTPHTFTFWFLLYQVTLCLEKVHVPFKRVVAITFSFFGSFTISFCFWQVLISDLQRTAFDAKCQISVEKCPLMFLMVSTFLIWM